MHDLGIPVIGDNCGWGSCAVYYRTDGLGCFTAFASPFNFLSYNRKSNIDYERKYVCDYFINHDESYRLFYDLDYLSNLINSLK